MTGKKPGPPGLALWLFRHACSAQYKEALAGDLVERFREGQTRSWFWRQVLIACTVGALRSIRPRWPLFCYAIAGTVAMGFSWNSPLRRVPASVHWSDLPWPWSQLVFEISSPAIAALTSLTVLTAGLVVVGSFRWASLVRTGIINLLLIAMGHFSLDACPWLLRPIPGDSYHKALIVPGAVLPLLVFFAFLVAAWLGCPMAARDGDSEGPAAERQ